MGGMGDSPIPPGHWPGGICRTIKVLKKVPRCFQWNTGRDILGGAISFQSQQD
jgi:hypothetical protein